MERKPANTELEEFDLNMEPGLARMCQTVYDAVRNSLASDLFFTAACALALEYRALRLEQPSLLRRQAA